LLHKYEAAGEAVRVTEVPEHTVVEPIAVMVAVGAATSLFTM